MIRLISIVCIFFGTISIFSCGNIRDSNGLNGNTPEQTGTVFDGYTLQTVDALRTAYTLQTAVTENDYTYLENHIAQGLPLKNVMRFPLLFFAKSDEMVRFLLANGADPLEEDYKRRNALALACERGADLKKLETLFELGIPTTSSQGVNLIAYCFRNPKIPLKITKYALERGALGENKKIKITALGARIMCVHYASPSSITAIKPDLREKLLEVALLIYSQYEKEDQKELIRLLTEGCELYFRFALVTKGMMESAKRLTRFLENS